MQDGIFSAFCVGFISTSYYSFHSAYRLVSSVKSNVSTDLPPDQRISDQEILDNVNTFMFAGSDTSSLTVTWVLYALGQRPEIQDRLRAEILAAIPDGLKDISHLTEEEVQALHTIIAELPFLNNVVRECIRLVPPVHSSIRVATQDDEIPTSYPIRLANGKIDTKTTITMPKGSFIHVGVEAFNLDREFWGEDAWEFKSGSFLLLRSNMEALIMALSYRPDRWDDLPEKAARLPGLYSNTLTFSAGPRVGPLSLTLRTGLNNST